MANDKTLSTESSSLVISTAYHEAGHAAASLVLGVGVRRVSIIPRNELDGSCSAGFVTYFSRFWKEATRRRCVRGQSSLRCRNQIEKKIKISLAGRLAERRFLGGMPSSRSAVRDNLSIAYHLVLLSDQRNEINSWAQLLRVQTENLLESHWPLIEAIAKLLLTSWCLTNAQLKRIYNQQLHPKRDGIADHAYGSRVES